MSDKNEIIGREYKCLDHGFVRLIDVMGDDASIVQAARVSYGAGTKSIREDRSLIRYLMRHKHTSPFEMVEYKFHIKLPIFVARQWIRHRTANVNEYSGRYSEMPDEFYIPEKEQVRSQSLVNKQGRSDELIPESAAEALLEKMKDTQAKLYSDYKDTLEQGVAREIARINLPLSNYTEWYWKIDLHNLFHFLKLRLELNAQYEIRVYAEIMADMVKAINPLAYEAFEDFILYSHSFSRQELEIIRELLGDSSVNTDELIEKGLTKREASDFMEKLNLAASIKDIK